MQEYGNDWKRTAEQALEEHHGCCWMDLAEQRDDWKDQETDFVKRQIDRWRAPVLPPARKRPRRG